MSLPRQPGGPSGRVPEELQRRFTVVVGKGGVGKSTAAGALALGLADAGLHTHLVSVDPAHSLGDLLDHPVPGADPVPSPCAPRLVVEELDARARGRAWLARLTPGVAELVELGSYLEPRHVPGLLEPALPGLDEVVAAMRLAELGAGGAERIVVDTPPTGHLLRLLDCGRLLDGWAEALEAMAEKAGAVQERLLRRRVRLAGDEVLDEVRRAAKGFEERVLPAADFLVVSGTDPLVTAETGRLVDRLRSRGCRVAAFLETTAERSRGTGGPRGCGALRRWWMEASVRAPGEGGGPAPEAPGGGSGGGRGAASGDGSGEGDLRFRLLEKDLLLFAGKGGVGKSTSAAACAVAIAAHRPVLLLGVDPAGSLGDLLGPLPGGGTAGTSLLGGRLRVVEVEPERELESLRQRYGEEVRAVLQRLGLETTAALDRRVTEAFVGTSPPGLDEIFALRSVLEAALRGGGNDGRAVIVDGAPTGHFLRLVEMPGPALEWSRAVMRVLLDHRGVPGLDELARGLLEFARGLRELLELLRTPSRTGVVVVTLDEPVVRAETGRLLEALEEREIPIASLLLNRHPSSSAPDRFPGVSGVPVAAAPELAEPPVGPRVLADFFSLWQVVR
jgi:arsenite/tail-anchored protein-transporting ATPase